MASFHHKTQPWSKALTTIYSHWQRGSIHLRKRQKLLLRILRLSKRKFSLQKQHSFKHLPKKKVMQLLLLLQAQSLKQRWKHWKTEPSRASPRSKLTSQPCRRASMKWKHNKKQTTNKSSQWPKTVKLDYFRYSNSSMHLRKSLLRLRPKWPRQCLKFKHHNLTVIWTQRLRR